MIQSLGLGAVVHVNGRPLDEGGAAQPLHHLDRIVFGPCRLLCLYVYTLLTEEHRGEGDECGTEYVHSFLVDSPPLVVA